MRLTIPNSVHDNIIEPFDKGKRKGIIPGLYPLTPPVNSRSLSRRREYDKTERKQKPKGDAPQRKHVVRNTSRVVLAAVDEGGDQ